MDSLNTQGKIWKWNKPKEEWIFFPSSEKIVTVIIKREGGGIMEMDVKLATSSKTLGSCKGIWHSAC